MAKRAVQRKLAAVTDAPKTSGEAFSIETLPRELKARFVKMRDGFVEYVKAWIGMRTKAEDIAPAFMALYNDAVGHVRSVEERELSFVEFARALDPSIPFASSGANSYKNNRAYQSALYLRRVASSGPRRKLGVDEQRQKELDGLAVDLTARALKTLVLVLGADRVWDAIAREGGLVSADGRTRKLQNLRKRVDAVEPLFKVSAKAKLGPAEVVHMPRSTEAAAEPSQQRKRA
jgi:hypothetical protein